jgi:hypothetical protein
VPLAFPHSGSPRLPTRTAQAVLALSCALPRSGHSWPTSQAMQRPHFASLGMRSNPGCCDIFFFEPGGSGTASTPENMWAAVHVLRSPDLAENHPLQFSFRQSLLFQKESSILNLPVLFLASLYLFVKLILVTQ